MMDYEILFLLSTKVKVVNIRTGITCRLLNKKEKLQKPRHDHWNI